MKRQLIQILAACSLAIAVAYLTIFLSPTPPAWAPMLLAVGTNGVIVSLMALGAVRHDTLPRSLVWTFAGLFVLCAGAFLVALTLPAREGAGGPLLLGLPLRTAILLYGVGVVPIGILPFAYALTFDASTLGERDLAGVRAARAAMHAEREA